MKCTVLVILGDDRCDMESIAFVLFTGGFARILLGIPSTKQTNNEGFLWVMEASKPLQYVKLQTHGDGS